jgi:N-acetylmuramoyl-L-alanine amidase
MKLNELFKIIWLAIAITAMNEVSYAQVASEAEHKFIVYIDPAYGGKENGPILLKKYKSKEIALSISNKLKGYVASKGITADLSRNEDLFESPDDRLTHAKNKGADIYIYITISLSDKNCIRIYFPKKQVGGNKEKNLDVIAEELKTDERLFDSIKCATFTADSLTKELPSFCIKARLIKSYVLEKAHCPAIMLDFSVAKSDPNPYLLDQPLLDNILKAVSEGIQDYLKWQRSKR